MNSSVVSKYRWKRYSSDLNTGSEEEYVSFLIKETAKECVEICSATEKNSNLNSRLAPVVKSITEACSNSIKERFSV